MDDLRKAVKDLRTRLGDSQQAFANRLGLSLRAVANYEAGRYPARAALWTLAATAGQTGNPDLESQFAKAYSAIMTGFTKPMNNEETAWVRMVLTLLRNKESVPQLTECGTTLLGALESLTSKNARMGTAEELDEAVQWARRVIRPSAELQLTNLAKGRMRGTGETFSAAFTQVLLENPDLYKKYQEERAGTQPATQPKTKSRGHVAGKKAKK